MRWRIFRNCFNVVSCQLLRWRLLPTAQAMKTRDTAGKNTSDVRLEQSLNACRPMDVSASVGGSAIDRRLEHPSNALRPIVCRVCGRVRQERLRQPANAELCMETKRLGSTREDSSLQ